MLLTDLNLADSVKSAIAACGRSRSLIQEHCSPIVRPLRDVACLHCHCTCDAARSGVLVTLAWLPVVSRKYILWCNVAGGVAVCRYPLWSGCLSHRIIPLWGGCVSYITLWSGCVSLSLVEWLCVILYHPFVEWLCIILYHHFFSVVTPCMLSSYSIILPTTAQI